MSEPFKPFKPFKPLKPLPDLDRLVHEPARLALLTALSGCACADFLFLQRLTGLTKGNMSVHLSKLEAGGLVEITKEFVGKKPRTVVRLSTSGRDAIEHHWKQLDAMRATSASVGSGLSMQLKPRPA